jgi:hypothetical protein
VITNPSVNSRLAASTGTVPFSVPRVTRAAGTCRCTPVLLIALGLVVPLGAEADPISNDPGGCDRGHAIGRPARAGQAGEEVIDVVPAGVWGGPHLRLEVTSDGAEVEFDCATGRIEGRLALDREQRFRARGTYRPEHAGPVRGDEATADRVAVYAGRVTGAEMTLTVTLADPADEVGTFELVRGSDGELVKCR